MSNNVRKTAEIEAILNSLGTGISIGGMKVTVLHTKAERTCTHFFDQFQTNSMQTARNKEMSVTHGCL